MAVHDRLPKVAYLFTTFPLLSETPYQRELRALRDLPVHLTAYSLWAGGRDFEGLVIRRFNKWRVLTLFWLLPFWVVLRPSAFLECIKRLGRGRLPSPLNAGETVLGLVFAICHAHRFNRGEERPDLIHAAWATMPATAAQFLADLTGVPFSMGAHAHDVFRHGGDWDLETKLKRAALIVTSSEYTRRRLIDRGAAPGSVALVRRGLNRRPAFRPPRPDRNPIRLLAVGRLIEKKGYRDQLAIYAALHALGLSFEARIVGAGPLRQRLEEQIAILGLANRVTLVGALPAEQVFHQYDWADVLLFTGKKARNGDRDGLPNVIPEAMACGVPVIATDIAAVSEAIVNDCTGIIVQESGAGPWFQALRKLQDDDDHYERLRVASYQWVEVRYDARKNAAALLDRFRGAIALRDSAEPASDRPAAPISGTQIASSQL